jgi:hypothetical protein
VGVTTGSAFMAIAIQLISATPMVTTEEREGNRVTDQVNDPHASVLQPAAAINPGTRLKLFTVAGWPLDDAKDFLIQNGQDLSGPYIIIQFPSWDSDRLMFVPTPLVDLTDGRAENDGGHNRVRASWSLSDAEATREWLSRFSLGFEGDCELATERPRTLRRLDSPAITLSLKRR